MAKIGLVAVDIIGLKGIVKNKKQQRNIPPAGPGTAQQPGGLNKYNILNIKLLGSSNYELAGGRCPRGRRGSTSDWTRHK